MILGPSMLNYLVEGGMVTPVEALPVKANSIDLRIGALQYHFGGAQLMKENRRIGAMMDVPLEDGIWTLEPDTAYIATTVETVNVPPNLAAKLIPRSTMTRAGILVNPGYIDPGYNGVVHFVFRTPTPETSIIEFGFPAVQLVFELAEPSIYQGVYQGGQLRPPQDKH